MESSNKDSLKRFSSNLVVDPSEVEPMIQKNYADLFGSQFNNLTNMQLQNERNLCKKYPKLLSLLKLISLFFLMYMFICSLELMSIGFRLIGGKSANKFLTESELLLNPIVGLMIGILVTILVQSSSTSTSIVVTMVSSDMIKVRNAIPIIMGANVGTSVTNTLVSFMQSGDRKEFERAFSAATIHDIFNWLSVFILLPIECFTHYLEWLTSEIIQQMNFENHSNKIESQSFFKQITSFTINFIVKINNHLLEKLRLSNDTNEENESLLMKCCDLVPHESLENCLDKCSIFNYFSLGDSISGFILLFLTILTLCSCLFFVVKLLNSMIKGKMTYVIENYINADFKSPWSYLIGYLALIIGCVMTIVVQSSSVFTSTLTPLAGLGVISLERIYPLTLGSNIGTTTTGLFAALTAENDKIKETFQLALCHLFFNITGILLFYPIPVTRIPIPLAKLLGKTAAKYRWFSIVYLIFFFFLLPALIFFLSLSGQLTFILIMTPTIILLISIIAINFLQVKFPYLLPSFLKNWSFLPKWFTSLDPYDCLIIKLAKRFPKLFWCIQSQGRHDLAMNNVLINNAQSNLQFLKASRNNSLCEVYPTTSNYLTKDFLNYQNLYKTEEYKKPKFDLDDSDF